MQVWKLLSIFENAFLAAEDALAGSQEKKLPKLSGQYFKNTLIVKCNTYTFISKDLLVEIEYKFIYIYIKVITGRIDGKKVIIGRRYLRQYN